MLPLLRTRTTIPPTRPRQVVRPRLLALMDEGAQRALTLIVAPAGFGKTTLAAAWAGKAPIPAAWLSLQATDRPRERLLSYLIQAIQIVAPASGGTSLALIHGGSTDGALYALVNDLADLQGELVVVLDDYHTVDSPETAAIIGFLLENRPAGFHLVIVTRQEPALNLARLRALDMVTEITIADLRFTHTEAQAFFETGMDLHLPSAELDRLEQSAEGWAVGLQLAGLALQRSSTDRAASAGQALIFDYMAQEVLAHEPPDVQEFLKISALFDRFCAPLCEAVITSIPSTNSERAESTLPPPTQIGGKEVRGDDVCLSLLAHVERRNLFLAPLDASGTWFRYHALFTDFLRRQLIPQQAESLYRRASRWFEDNGLLDDAIHYAVHAADFERAAALLENHYRDLLQRGEQAALLEWISALPTELLQARPRLWLARGWSGVISFDSRLSLDCAANAEALLPTGVDWDPLRGEAKALRILAGIFGGQFAGQDDISAAFNLLDEQDSFLHSLLHFNLGLHQVMQGNTSLAVEAFSETLRLTQAVNNPLVTIIAWVQLAEARMMRGALGLAERSYQQVLDYTRRTLGENTMLLGLSLVSYAELLREQNHLEEAASIVERGINYCQTWQPVTSLDGLVTLARLRFAQGDREVAAQALVHATRLTEASSSVLDDTYVAIHRARLALLDGDLEEAEQFIHQYKLESLGNNIVYHLWELVQLTLCRRRTSALTSGASLSVRVTQSTAQGLGATRAQALGHSPADSDPPVGERLPAVATSPVEALLEDLASLTAASEARERVTALIEGLILTSYTQHAAGRHTQAISSLSHALALGAQGGYVRLFADEGRPLLHLLEQYRGQLHAPRSYLERITSLMHQEAARPRPPSARVKSVSANLGLSGPPFSELTTLTRAELDVLQLLADGKSNQEIAAERVIALNTVKKHVSNILSKLGATNRTQAVILARKMGLI